MPKLTTCAISYARDCITHLALDITTLSWSDCKMFVIWARTLSSYWWAMLDFIAGSGWVTLWHGRDMLRSNVIILHRSNIFVPAFSYFSNNWGKCVSSSHDDPQPNTRAKSFPVPKGNTPIWHCFCKFKKYKYTYFSPYYTIP